MNKRNNSIGNFTCDECDANFGESGDMKKHKQRNHDQNWGFVKEDFVTVPQAWINFSLDHEYFLVLSLQQSG